MDYERAIGRIHEHLAADETEAAAMACVRVASLTRDFLNAAIFLTELYPDKRELGRLLQNDARELTDEAKRFIWKAAVTRSIELHEVEGLDPDGEDLPPGDRRNVLMISAGEIDAELERWQQTLSGMVVPSDLDPADTLALLQRFDAQRHMIYGRMRALQIIKSRIKARCLSYAVDIERQLLLQRRGQGFLDAVQNDVHNYFKGRADDVYVKLQKAAELAASDELEDGSLLLTEVRRALKAASDFFYPAAAERVVCADGKERILDDQQYLNRLHQFLATRLPQSTARDLLESELDHLVSFMHRLNDMASKGAHGSVTLTESKQGLVGLYFFLYNVCQRLEARSEP